MASLRSQIETALVSHLTSAAVGATVYPGLSAGDKVLPCVIAKVRKLTEEPIASGNFNAALEISVEANPDSNGTFDAICTAVETAIWNDELDDDLNALDADLTVHGLASGLEIEFPTDPDIFQAVFTFEIHAAQI
jgi:hypothetical protein